MRDEINLLPPLDVDSLHAYMLKKSTKSSDGLLMRLVNPFVGAGFITAISCEVETQKILADLERNAAGPCRACGLNPDQLPILALVAKTRAELLSEQADTCTTALAVWATFGVVWRIPPNELGFELPIAFAALLFSTIFIALRLMKRKEATNMKILSNLIDVIEKRLKQPPLAHPHS